MRRPSAPPATGARRTPWIVGGLVGALAVLGAASWAAWSFFATGPQPAEALPDSTLAYLSVDLDPSGGQKIEAVRTLRKFPAFKDKIGLETDDDVRQRIFEEIQGSAGCEDLDYGDDVEPWLGDRMAVAAVDTREDTPTPVVVLQVTDDDKADAGLQKLRECGGGDSGAWSISDGWAVIGESQDLVDGIADDAADAPLSDDDDFTRWTDEAGDSGIATGYLAPEAGALIADQLGQVGDPTGLLAPTGATDALKQFQGMAATLRFDDGSLELEVAADPGDSVRALGDSDRGDDVLATLPDDTAAAFGLGLSEGWFSNLVDQMASSMGTGESPDDLMAELSDDSGLDLPEDAETLAGDSVALAIGGDFDVDEFSSSSDGSGVPVGLKVSGDADKIQSVLDKIRPQLGPEDTFLDTDSEGDTVVLGPDPDYRQQLLDDGDLGSSDVFENVVREADDAAAILFVNFDAGDWLEKAAADDPEAAENLAPLEGLGLSAWLDGDVSHLVLRVTTD